MADILRTIESYKRREIAKAREREPDERMWRRAREAPPPRGFVEAMGGTLAASNRTDRRGAAFTMAFDARARRAGEAA